MLANWVRQSTSTTGTGAITLDGTPPAGFVAFKDVFQSGQIVQYVIEDGNNREVGYGTLTSGANWTLSRDKVLETLDGGVFTRNPPSPISLSGSAVVGVDATSYQSLFAVPKLARGYSVFPCEIVSATGIGNDRLYFMPLIHFGGLITSIGAHVSAASTTGGKFRCGLYTAGNDGKPSTLIIESGDLDPTTTGLKVTTLASPLYLPPGYYWGAIVDSGSNATFKGDGGYGRRIQWPPLGGGFNNAGGMYVNLSAGWTSLPSSVSPTSYHTGYMPHIVLGIG